MTRIFAVLAVLATLASPATAHDHESAEKPVKKTVELGFTAYLEVAFANEDGKFFVPAPVLDLELGGAFRLHSRVQWYVGLSAAITFQANVFPAPRIITGPVFEVVPEKFYMSPTALYQLNVPYGDAKLTHTVGGGLEMFGLVGPMALGVVVGAGTNVGADVLPNYAIIVAPNFAVVFYDH